MKRFTLQLLLATALCCGVVLGVFGISQSRMAKNLVVHEWGTFTSVQGSDGEPLYWQSSDIAPLPSFVYNWSHSGLEGKWIPSSGLPKGSMMILQRMETPVVYFYSDREQVVDLAVQFPQGRMTEWYPRATEAGPAVFVNGGSNSFKASLLHWADVHVLPHTTNGALRHDTIGSHYYSARETDSANLRIETGVTNKTSEYEKFLFYRGEGAFKTPLRVSMSNDGTVDLENTGNEPLTDLFVLEVRHGQAHLKHVKDLKPSAKQQVELTGIAQPIDQLNNTLSNELATALIAQKLFKREASAMVATWKSSWFEEEGTRVLYLLPRKWTDQILPITIEPKPRELTRVMVGRAEVISPKQEKDLAEAVQQMSKGDFEARLRVHQMLTEAGRFAQPFLTHSLEAAKLLPLSQRAHAVLSDGLVFDSVTKDYSAKPGEEEAHFKFRVANLSAKEVVIERAQGTCGCTRAELPAQPWHIKPSARGEIPVVMYLKGKPPGEIIKEVTLFASDGQHKLTVKTVVPTPTPIKTASVSQ